MLDFGTTASRRMVHHRRIECVAYARDDGRVDVDAWLLDTRGHEMPTTKGLLPAGEPLHHTGLRVTIDLEQRIVAVAALTLNGPSTECPDIASSYAGLAGLQLGPGFRDRAKAPLRGSAGCTHLTELLGPMATTALQAIWWLRRQAQERLPKASVSTKRETLGQVDSCFAWRRGGLLDRFQHQQSAGEKLAE